MDHEAQALAAEAGIAVLHARDRAELHMLPFRLEKLWEKPAPSAFDGLPYQEQQLEQSGLACAVLPDQDCDRPKPDGHRLAEGTKIPNLDRLDHGGASFHRNHSKRLNAPVIN